jgi:hypothetical protein
VARYPCFHTKADTWTINPESIAVSVSPVPCAMFCIISTAILRRLSASSWSTARREAVEGAQDAGARPQLSYLRQGDRPRARRQLVGERKEVRCRQALPECRDRLLSLDLGRVGQILDSGLHPQLGREQLAASFL